MAKKILITSALPYINGYPHLGHLAGCLLTSDVYARFCRMMGREVLYLCATDEHGTASEIGAAKEGMSVADYCTKYYEVHKKMYEGFNLSFDYFGRSSSEANKKLTQEFFLDLEKNGFTEERSIKQIYSIDDKRFLPDRYVVGTCPFCGYEKARGDQCENCTKVLDPTDLLDPKSAISGSSNLEVRESKHIFLNLPKLEKEVDEWIESKKNSWPTIAYSIAKKWLKEGLKERSITRDLKWGVQVPKAGFEDKVFYVWFDAPIEYIAAGLEWAEIAGADFKSWWQGGDDVYYVEFMGKDNVPFHTVWFPAVEIGSRKPWKKVDFLKGVSYLNFNGGKFSKSDQRGVFADQALTEYAADYWRYFIIANLPESDDSDFTFEKFASDINKDLNDVLGNFVLRVLKFCASKFGSLVPEASDYTDEDEDMIAELARLTAEYYEMMDKMEYRKAHSALRAIWSLGNNYFAGAAPWEVIKKDEKRAKTIVNIGINLVRIFALLAHPIIPTFAGVMLSSVGASKEKLPSLDMAVEIRTLKAGHEFKVPDVLFEKISDERIAELNDKYGANKK